MFISGANEQTRRPRKIFILCRWYLFYEMQRLLGTRHAPIIRYETLPLYISGKEQCIQRQPQVEQHAGVFLSCLGQREDDRHAMNTKSEGLWMRRNKSVHRIVSQLRLAAQIKTRHGLWCVMTFQRARTDFQHLQGKPNLHALSLVAPLFGTSQ